MVAAGSAFLPLQSRVLGVLSCGMRTLPRACPSKQHSLVRCIHVREQAIAPNKDMIRLFLH